MSWGACRLLARHREAVVVVGLLALTIVGEWPLLQGRIVAGVDSLTQFYPWYELVGATLRAGHLPGWNPYSMAGAPLAGNPLSGWTYLPAMLAFTALPFRMAVVVYQLAHVMLAALATYALSRALGSRLPGAAMAAVTYSQSGLVGAEAACCFAFASVGAWLPVLLLGSELAMQAGRWRRRIRGWSLAALALSQILASWLGQGSYYAVLVFVSFVAFRLLAGRSQDSTSCASSRQRVVATIGWLGLHVMVPVGLGVGLAAAGLLPRIELNALSSLAGGYGAEDQHVGGWTVQEWATLIEPGYWYVGLVVAATAALAPWLARRRHLCWYLLALGSTLLVLAMPGPSPVHAVFELLPGFVRLHPHLPDRIVTVFMLVPALLAGMTVDTLARMPRFGAVVAVCLIGAAFADLRVAREHTFGAYAEAEGVHRLMTTDLDAYYAPTPAARFLQERVIAEGPFRYLGYGPDTSSLVYTQRFADPRTVQLGVNNRAVPDRLLDVQGYDAVHLARFDALLRTANGRTQNYHNADLFAPGLRSPLLDLLAARYLVVPSMSPGYSDGTPLSDPRLSTVFDDGQTRVLRHERALPWVWVVHEGRAACESEAFDLIDRGLVDPHQTVLLEPPIQSPLELESLLRLVTGAPRSSQAELPDLSGLSLPGAPDSGSADDVAILQFEADHLRVRTRTATDGILVLAEVAYPGWVATVDGAPTPIYFADGLLRAVPLPAGEHLVELRFESTALRAGVAISLLTGLMLLGGCLTSLFVSGRCRQQGPAESGRPSRRA